MIIPTIVRKVFSRLPVFVLGWLVIEAVFFTPLIRWNWGFYNTEMIVTAGLLIMYSILITWMNTITIMKELRNLNQGSKE